MIFDSATLCEVLYREVIVNDAYRLRSFVGREVRKFIDIGANYGMTSIMARMLFPAAEIFSFEPNPTTYAGLCTNTEGLHITCFQHALGDGRPVSSHKFWAGESASNFVLPGGDIPSSLLSDVFNMVGGVDRHTIVKIDCEGGEQYIPRDTAGVDALRNSMYFAIETHANNGSGGPQVPFWLSWLTDFARVSPQRVAECSRVMDMPENTISEDYAVLYSRVP